MYPQVTGAVIPNHPPFFKIAADEKTQPVTKMKLLLFLYNDWGIELADSLLLLLGLFFDRPHRSLKCDERRPHRFRDLRLS